jgi:hypothetical protein
MSLLWFRHRLDTAVEDIALTQKAETPQPQPITKLSQITARSTRIYRPAEPARSLSNATL